MKRVCFSSIMIFLMLNPVFAKTSTILGYVFKSPESLSPVKGAVVKLIGENGKIYLSQSTQDDGSYIIKGIERGKYKIKVIYKGKEYKAVFTIPGKIHKKNKILLNGGELIVSLALKPGKDLIALLMLGGSPLIGGISGFTTSENPVSPVK